ncbi:MAG: septal ring lytic transglycosylase RlpA family protein [Candidatus Korobacteraceae bacterium]
MRRGLTSILVMLVAIPSLAAAPQSSDSSNTSLRAQGSTASTKVVKASRQVRPKPYQVGKASWYGKFFHGKATASGEPYDMFLFTAAHRELPLGSLVKVTNLRNGSNVVVRINDRGPVPETRVIDLSYAAAQILGVRQGGIGRVQLDIIETPAMARNLATHPGMP